MCLLSLNRTKKQFTIEKQSPRISIVIADDHDMFRLAIVDVLSAVPEFNVIGNAENGKALISQIEELHDIPDICLLDISMPEMDGYATLRVLQERWPKIKVLALSMHTEYYPMLRMLTEGASGFLAKNMKPAQLIKAIHGVDRDGSYFEGIPRQLLKNGIPVDGSLIPQINGNELEFLALSCTDMTYTQIADKLGKSARTIENYRDNLFKKLKVKSRTDMVLFALRSGLVQLERNENALR